MAVFSVNNSNNRFTLQLTLTEGAYNQAENTSPITYKLELIANTSNHFTNFGIGRKIVLGGVTVFEGARKSGEFSISSYGTLTLASGTCTITHEPDGSKNLSVEYSIDMKAESYTPGTLSDTGTMELVQIPRYVLITSAPNFTDEENPCLWYKNSLGDAVTSAEACISLDGSMDDIKYRPIPVNGTSYTFELTEEERNVLRQATLTSQSRSVMFFIRSVVGGVQYLSYKTKTLTIVNANPIFLQIDVDYMDINNDVVNITRNSKHIVQNQSNLLVTVDAAEGRKGATIKNYTIECNGVASVITGKGAVNVGKVNVSQDVQLKVTVKDSRGYTTEVVKTVTVLPWRNPTARASVGRPGPFADDVFLRADVVISSVNEKNTATITYKHKPSGGKYGDAVPIENNVAYSIACTPAQAHTFLVEVTDAFGGTASCEVTMPRGIPTMFIDTQKSAVSINTFPESGEALRVADGLAVFDDGIVLKSANKSFKITINDSGSFVIEEMK